MQVSVDQNKVEITSYDTVNSGEYNVHQCDFTFSSDYDGLVKVAVFTTDRPYKILIESNNTCKIPTEVLARESVVSLGVYAYQSVDNRLQLRYSPMQASFLVTNGSYKDNAQLVLSPDPDENIVIQLEELLAEIQHDLDTGAFDGEDGFSPTITEEETFNGYHITITDVNGTTSIDLYNGQDGKDGKDGEQGPQGEPGKDRRRWKRPELTVGMEQMVLMDLVQQFQLKQ